MSETLNRRLAKLSPDQIKGLVDRLAQAPAVTPRMPRNPANRYPLSAAQERLWFLAQLSPGSPAFNNPAALRMRPSKPLDHARLQRAFTAMGQRHEILRTTFDFEEGRPGQRVYDEIPLTVEWVDLRGASNADTEAMRLAVAEGRRQFDLTSGPLMALKVLEIGALDYILLITSHHIISDGWSNAIFARELPALYEGQALPSAEVQYIDYVFWEREWLTSAACQEQLRYWQERIDPDEPPLALPTDHPRPRGVSHAGGLETRALPASTAERLRALARQERMSLFSLMMSALAALLHRYSGSSQLSIGTVTANRDRRDFQTVMGPLLNTLVIRCGVERGETLRSLLRSVHETCREALRRQDLPFNVLLNALKVRRDYGVHPLFQVMLVYQNIPAQYESAGTQTEVVKIDYGTTKFDLNFWIEEINNTISLTLHYARTVFSRSTARRILAEYDRALACLLDHPDMPIEDLPILDIVGTAPTPGSLSKPDNFVTRFEHQAALSPEHAAVWCPDGTLTYRELDQAAERIARHLRRRGAARDEPIGLLATRSRSMIAAILGILKSGAPYLPLNPSDTRLRWHTMLEDAGVRILVVDAKYAKATALLSVDVVDLSVIPDEPDNAVCKTMAPGDLVYLIYTSGSTGAPKGVGVEHRNLVAYVDGVWKRMALDAGDRFATVTSIATDLGNTMIFAPLAHGGCVVVVPEEAAVDAAALASLYEREAVDCLKITPTHLQALLDHPGILPRKLLVLGGEACDATLIERIRSLRPDLRVLNHYGPTETTIGVLTYELPNPWPGGAPPLGEPIEGVRVEICDRTGRALPPGVSGEIVIGGDMVSRGYWKRPDLTAEYFITDSTGNRCYRTGDLGKRLGDGTIAFLGRTDRQLKLRGHRIEPGEIEGTLACHPSIAQAAVRLDPPDRLVAFVATREPTNSTALTEYLRERLPVVMVPRNFVFVDALPRTPSGKVDLAALPGSAVVTRDDAVEPRDDLELALTLIWCELLGSSSIGVHDNFFDAGGHSLLAVQLMARIRERFGRELPLASLFEHGTIAALAALLRERGTMIDGPLVTIRPGNDAPPLVLVHPAGGDVLCYFSLAQELDIRCAIIGVKARTADGDPSIPAMARRYCDALGAKAPRGLVGWSMGALVAFEMARLFQTEQELTLPIAILDQPAPALTADASDEDDLGLMLAFARKASEFAGAELGIDRTQLESRSPQARSAVFLESFKRYGLAPEATRAEDFDRYLQLMLAHNRCTQMYRPAPYSGEVTVFRAENALAQNAEGGRPRPPDLGWERWCFGALRVVSVPGNHVSMMRKPHVAALAARIAEALQIV